MGLDFLDITFRLEKAFTIKLPDDWHKGMQLVIAPKFDMTAGALHDHVCEHLRRAGLPVPHSSWNRVKKVLVDALGVKPAQVRRDRWLVKDLGAGF